MESNLGISKLSNKALALALVSLALVIGALFVYNRAQAGIGVAVSPDFPANVSVGQTNVAGALNITNNSTSDVGSINLTGIFLTPSCGDLNVPCSGGELDPGVFTIDTPATGAGACAANTFTVAEVDAASGRVQFTPNAQITLALGATCVINFTFDVVGLPDQDAVDAGTLQTVQGAQVTAVDNTATPLPGSGTGTDITTVQSANIIIEKQTTPNGSNQSFSFNPSYSATDFNLTDGQQNNSGPLAPGAYSVVENATTGWTQTSAVCTSSIQDAETLGAIELDAGETVTCVVTNTQESRIIVDKVTLPAGDTQSFAFTTTGSGYAGFNLTDAGAPNNQALAAGTYSVNETAVAGWNNTSVNCVSSIGDTEIRDNLELDAGETITCTFTNTRNGTIIVDKVTSPSGSTQSFNFTTTGSGYNGFSLTDAATPNSQSVVPGTYSIAEGAVAGWNQTSATCSDGSPISAIVVGAGETVTCTVTNTQQMGTIIVDKVTTPAGDTQSFIFTTTGSGYTGFNLTDAGTPNSQQVMAGTYSVAETAVNGWTQTSATCSDGSPVTAIVVSPGETVTCTFTNTKQGRIIVDKVTSPAGNTTNFEFDTNYGDNFLLADGSTVNTSAYLNAGTYSVAEVNMPAGWTQSSATCSDGSAVTAINLAAGETVTCTFTNTQQSRIIVDKVTNPSGDTTSFAFTTTGAGYNGFNLADGSAVNNQVLPAGTYSVRETSMAGWTQTSATCDNGQTPGNIVLTAGMTVTCTFINTKVMSQGCSPGYWKQPQHFGSYPNGVYPNSTFSSVFGSDAFGSMTLLQVLSQGGGGLNALGRHIVAAYLNAASVTNFPYTTAQVIADFQSAYASGNYSAISSKYEALQDPCPLGRNPGPAGPGETVADKPKNNGKVQ